MFLTSILDTIAVVTGSAVSTIGVHADWVDKSGSTITPERLNTPITTAATTTVVAAPGVSTVRNVKGLTIENNHASSSCVVTVRHSDTVTAVDLMKVTLRAGEALDMAEDGEWRHLTAAGGEYEYSAPGGGNLGITGTVAETMPREITTESNNATLTTGSLYLSAVNLKAGQVVTNISFFSATTAAGTPTNQFFALYDANGHLRASSANATTAAWAANAIKTLAMTAAYTVPASGLYYIGIMVSATTVPTLKGVQRSSNTINSRPFQVSYVSTAGLTTVLPDMAALTTAGGTNPPWAAIT